MQAILFMGVVSFFLGKKALEGSAELDAWQRANRRRAA